MGPADESVLLQDVQIAADRLPGDLEEVREGVHPDGPLPPGRVQNSPTAFLGVHGALPWSLLRPFRAEPDSPFGLMCRLYKQFRGHDQPLH
ncbi:hypothetical protein GCM10010221_52730 [Streptomyces parvus]|nr:hypothetical protein GCM10010221_52730 [Streptomyces parvus]